MRHLRNELDENALQLGLNIISDTYIDDDGHVKITLTPSRSLSHTSRPHAILVAVDLCYIWKTTGDHEDSTNLLSDANPFADNLYLPFELLLKRVTEQLFNQLVGCVSAVRAEYMRSHMTQTLSPYLWHVAQKTRHGVRILSFRRTVHTRNHGAVPQSPFCSTL
ncbi:hypothetical protein BDR03DRAFT_953914 [Suillus americanus]|nr:hypothetical protein BDR03DRAFT_953914 [Suillus americanus]